MANVETLNQELLTKNESQVTSGEQIETEEEEGSRPASGKDKGGESKDYRRKKQDALEGKENKESREDSDREDSTHHSADKAEGEDTTSHSRQGLQSGQTTVQFSSGGSMSASLTSLLGLFASSANLIRAETGSVLNLASQQVNINLRSVFHATTNQVGNLLGEEGKIVKGTINIATEQTTESTGYKINVDLGGLNTTHGSVGSQELLLNLLKSISTQATDTGNDLGNANTVTVFSTGTGFTFIPSSFNPNTFFPNPSTQFAFASQAQPFPSAVVINKYLSEAGLPVTGLYSYELLSPAGTTTGSQYTNGITFLQPTTGSLSIQTQAHSTDTTFQYPSLSVNGITLSPQGSLLVNVTQPMSVLVDVIPAGASLADALPVRIDAAPGIDNSAGSPTNIVTSPNQIGGFPSPDVDNTMLGLQVLNTTGTSTYQFENTLFISNPTSGYGGANTIVGNAMGITLNSPQSINASYFTGANGESVSFTETTQQTGYTTLGSSTVNFLYPEGLNAGSNTIVGGFEMPDTYVFPSSTIFRHIGDSLTGTDAVPTEAVYGNFSEFVNYNQNPATITYSTIALTLGTSYNLTFGGNVLDVYGTKYGVGDVLDVILPQSLNTQNTIYMGGNTLAGFGTAYGDLQTLNISGDSGTTSQISPQASIAGNGLTIEFRGNIENVDKSIDSILFPHLQNLDISNTISSNSGITLKFDNSYISGNAGNNTFYGDVQNLGDFGNSALYNGFILGVTETNLGASHTSLGNVEIQAGSNTIIYGNNTYVSGHSSTMPGSIDTYNFTLVGDQNGAPIMQGNAVIMGFNPSTDVLNFQLTPAVFKDLDINHNKTFSALGLDSGVFQTITNLNTGAYTINQSSTVLDPSTLTSLGMGTTIDFLGGGSLSLVGTDIDSFADIPQANLQFEINITYQPVAPIAPAPHQPLIYGEGPTSGIQGAYYNELDNFFLNSLFATYSVASPANVPLANVSIDQYGTINVNTNVPYFIPLTITAQTVNPQTQNVDTAQSTFLFGFLDAPITKDLSGNPIFGSLNSQGNILEGGSSSVITGGTLANYAPNPVEGTSTGGVTVDGGIYSLGLPTLISDPFVGTLYVTNPVTHQQSLQPTTAYGDYQSITIEATGISGTSVTNSVTHVTTVTPYVFGQGLYDGFGTITGATYNTNDVASYVYGTTYGVAQTLTLSALGGNYITTNVNTNYPHAFVNDSGNFNSNIFNFAQEALYGYGTIFGNLQTLVINAIGGTNVAFQVSGLSNPNGSLNVSASVSGNIFNFSPVNETVTGDSIGQTTTLDANINTLNITTQTNYIRTDFSNLSISSLGTFAYNQFIFAPSETETGGLGNTIFSGNIANLGDPYGFANPTTPTPYGYTGFVDGVTVSTVSNDLTTNQLMITDKNYNSITYSNIIYTGGQGTNTYDFTIVKDTNWVPIMQGHDTITNFVIGRDVIVLNIESNLFAKLQMMNGSPGNLADLTPYISVNNDVIQFLGPNNEDYGSITLPGLTLSSLADLGPSIQIVQTGTPYAAPTLVTPPPAFDPVFVQSSLQEAFLPFINGDASTLSFSFVNGATSAPNPNIQNDTIYSYPTAPGITLDSLGTLTVNPTGPVDLNLYVQVTDGITNLNLPSMQIFAINASDDTIHRDGTNIVMGSNVYSGTYEPGISLAFETSTPGNTIIGGGLDINYTATTPTQSVTYGSNLIYDVSSSTTGTPAVTTGHTAIGSFENVNFTNDGTATEYNLLNNNPILINLSGQQLTFNSNLFDVNAYDSNAATNGAGIYGTDKNLTFSVAGATLALVDNKTGQNIEVLPVNSYITGNTITFNSNTEYGNGNLIGAVGTLSLLITDPTQTFSNGSGGYLTVGSGFIQNNLFIFDTNSLTSQPVSSTVTGTATLDGAIGTLIMADQETSTYTHSGTSEIGGTDQGQGNTFAFEGSNLIGGSVPTTFNQDIANLAQTDLATNPVTVNPNNGVDTITDSNGNNFIFDVDVFTPGMVGNSTYNINLLNTASGQPVNLGGDIINYTTGDNLHFNLTRTLYRALDTSYDRTLTPTELNALATPQMQGTDTVIDFAGGGYILLPNMTVVNLSDLNVTASLIYNPAPITVANSNPDPLILYHNGGTNGATNGVYGLIFDPYFNNLDISNVGSTYGFSNPYSQYLTIPITGNPNIEAPQYPAFPEIGINPTYLDFSSDSYGTVTANAISSLAPVLSLEIIAPHDVNFSTNHPQLTLMIGEFNNVAGQVLTDTGLQPDPITNVVSFTGSASQPSYLQGIQSNEIMVGNLDPVVNGVNLIFSLSYAAYNSGVYNFSTEPGSTTYGGTTYSNNGQFGGNLIINTTPGTVAYGDFENINLNFVNTSSTTSLEVDNLVYQFGQNVFDVNGTVYGIANNFVLDISQPRTDGEGNSIPSYADKFIDATIVFGNTADLSGASGSYGNETIYGEGTIYGVLNTMEMDVSNATVDTPIFDFASSEVVITGNQFSTVFSNLDRLVLTGAPNSYEINFGNDLIIGGPGGGNFYPGVNDMSNTPFWTANTASNSMTLIESTGSPFVRISDSGDAFKINWGYHAVVLGGGNNIINVDLLDIGDANSSTPAQQHIPVPTGSYSIYNFNAATDVIRFNISLSLYDTIGTPGSVTSSDLYNDFHNLTSLSQVGNDTLIIFNGGLSQNSDGFIDLVNFSTADTFDQFAATNIQIGTTFDGTGSGSVNDPLSTIPFIVNSFATFQEYDQISYFVAGSDTIQLVLPQKLYDLTQSGSLTNTTLNSIVETSTVLAANAATSTGGITVTETPAQFTSSNGVTTDATLNFETNGVTSGSLLLHNVAATQLSDLGNSVVIDQEGVSGISNTYTYVIPGDAGNDLTSFLSDSAVISFNNSTPNHDILQLVFSPGTYEALSSDGTLNGTVGAAQLAVHAGDSTGGFVVTSAGGNTYLLIENTPSGTPETWGQIELGSTNITSLSGLGTYLHVGYVEVGTLGNAHVPGDTFTYNISGNNFNTFTQFDHIVNFDVTKDVIQVIAPAELYYDVNTQGILSNTALLTALANDATTSATGGIALTTQTAQYTGAVPDDTVLTFTNSSDSPNADGAITIHNFDASAGYSSFGSAFQFESTQDISQANANTIAFNANPNGTDMSSFTQIAHVTNFAVGGTSPDIIQIELPVSVFNIASNNGTFNSGTIEANLEINTDTSQGGIAVVTTNGSSSLDFVTNGDTASPWGSITLDGVAIHQLTSLGNQLEFGSIQEGSATGGQLSAQNFTFDAFNVNLGETNGPADLSGFTQFSHIVDFNNTAVNGDALTVDISQNLYNVINNFFNPPAPPLPQGTATNSQLISALDYATDPTGAQTGGSVIKAVEVAAQFPVAGAPMDTILEFINNINTTPTITGTITLHNVNLNGSIAHLNNLLITHH